MATMRSGPRSPRPLRTSPVTTRSSNSSSCGKPCRRPLPIAPPPESAAIDFGSLLECYLQLAGRAGDRQRRGVTNAVYAYSAPYFGGCGVLTNDPD